MSLTQAKPCSIPNVDFAPSAGSPPWYAVYTLPRHEKAIAEHLGFRQVETYLPLYLSARRWAGRRALVQLPLFPGYVFVRISARERIRVVVEAGLCGDQQQRARGHDGHDRQQDPADDEPAARVSASCA